MIIISRYCSVIDTAGLEPHRADDLFRPSTIVNDIWAYTKKAKVLIADLTGKNANVFYELGLAHALGKPVILIAGTTDDIPFDLRSLRVLLYDKNANNWGQLLRDKIQGALKEVLETPTEAVLPAFLNVKPGKKPTVSAEKKDFIEVKQELDLLRRELRSRDDEISNRMDERPKDKSFDIGPGRANALVRNMVDARVPDHVIVSRLQGFGPPRGWILDRIRTMKQERASRLIRVARAKRPTQRTKTRTKRRPN